MLMDASKQGTGDKIIFALPFYSASISCGCFVGMFAYGHKKYLLAWSCLSIYLHVSAWLPLDGLYWNLILDTFMKICWENIGHFTWRL